MKNSSNLGELDLHPGLSFLFKEKKSGILPAEATAGVHTPPATHREMLVCISWCLLLVVII